MTARKFIDDEAMGVMSTPALAVDGAAKSLGREFSKVLIGAFFEKGRP